MPFHYIRTQLTPRLLSMVGINFNHAHAANLQLSRSTPDNVEVRNIVQFQIAEMGIATHTPISHLDPNHLHTNLIQIIDHTVIIRDMRTRFTSESDVRYFRHIRNRVDSVICSRV